jgi:hypothetical protein
VHTLHNLFNAGALQGLMKHLLLLLLGLLVYGVSMVCYFKNGYGLAVSGLFLVGCAIIARFFFLHRSQTRLKLWGKKDSLVLLFLLILFTPLYAARLDIIPWQIGTDEIAVTKAAKIAASPTTDVFGISNYLGHPNLLFMGIGYLGKVFGGNTIENMRKTDALAGILTVLISYVLFRLLSLPQFPAVFAVLLLGLNHAFWAISRMALRNNSALLALVGAITLALIGLRKRCPWYTFLGGLVAGLSFYVYFPSRIVIGVWILFLFCAFFLRSAQIPRARIVCLGFVFTLGVVLTALPVNLATITAYEKAFSHMHKELLIFPEAREYQKQWYHTDTVAQGLEKTVTYGLTVFNNNIVDHAWIYVNPGHGFVDPLTGILLWVGLISILVQITRKKQSISDCLAAVGFLSTWLFFAFFTGKSPNYTRLLVILPWVAYLSVKGILWTATRLSEFLRLKPQKQKRAQLIISLLLIFIILAWNASFLYAYVVQGLEQGEVVGSTGRYVLERAHIQDYTYYIVSNKTWSYYSWGGDWQWRDWLGFFVQRNNSVIIVPPLSVMKTVGAAPFSVFSLTSVAPTYQRALLKKYPAAKQYNLTQQHVVFEVGIP